MEVESLSLLPEVLVEVEPVPSLPALLQVLGAGPVAAASAVTVAATVLALSTAAVTSVACAATAAAPKTGVPERLFVNIRVYLGGFE